jgi:hypothetical protein
MYGVRLGKGRKQITFSYSFNDEFRTCSCACILMHAVILLSSVPITSGRSTDFGTWKSLRRHQSVSSHALFISPTCSLRRNQFLVMLETREVELDIVQISLGITAK